MIGLDDVKQLLQRTQDQTLTVYLNVDPGARENQTSPPAWRIWLRDALKTIEQSRNANGAWRGIRARAESYLTTYRPSSKGLAMFIGPGFQQVYELPIPVENRADYGKPPVTPLLWAIDEYESYLIVMVDREQAHFYTAYLGEVGFQGDMQLELDTTSWREKSGAQPSTGTPNLGRGSSTDQFDHRFDEGVRAFHRQVAEQINRFVERHGKRRVVLGGDEEAAQALREILSEQAAEAVVEALSIPMRFSAHEIMQRVQPRALAYERRAELALVEQVIDLAKAGDRGALGREAVTQAVERGRVELLLAPWPADDHDLLGGLVERVLAANGAIELVHGGAADRLNAEGGLGARLYYAA